MRLVTYRSEDTWKPGVLRGEYIVDLNEALHAADVLDGPSYGSVREFLEASSADFASVSARVLTVEAEKVTAVGHLSEVVLGPPVPDPGKVLCVGLNYSDHVGETGRKFPDYPDIFSKFDTSLIGSFAPIDCSAVTDNLDFEGELAIVIGRRAHRVDEADAMSYVAGVTVLNDITARDLQYRGTQWLAGKAVDGSTPCGPALVTLDEVDDPQNLDITTRVNGVQVQGSNTRNMIFPLARIVSYISSFLALAPGDIIATGTPEGIGAKRTPPQWLRAGDTVEVEIETVGLLSNVVK